MRNLINLLNELEEIWDDDYLLFAAAGSLCLVNMHSFEIIEFFPAIHCDGGDPDVIFIDGKEYLDLE